MIERPDIPGDIRIMVAEGNAGYLRAVLQLLQQHRRIHVVGSAGSAAEAAALIEQHRPQLALIGIKLPDRAAWNSCAASS